ncbi:MlaD family protein [Nocardia jinanensis]|uniref:Mce family protein n=1 Tax=Nocardia jinanensis TaxID=382504 RepID=A0A917VR21_9NOCA|nr:MlaD family protein [Nocardia jinanensis]GGL10183.1 putative Mce family protein [Nocardia jinanensis]
MRFRVEFAKLLAKIGAAALVSVLLFVIIINAIKNPIDGDQQTYTAEFTDVSGLHVNGDIRAKGVQIGKIHSIELRRKGDATVADVGFSLVTPHRLTENTTLAVKYQNLTGVRYVDMQVPEPAGPPVDHLTTHRTRPSYDITELFNGLQPVLATMGAEEINQFTENAIALLQGDGEGLAPMLDSVQKLADLAHDREQVISTLTANVSRISDALGGRSTQVVEFLKAMSFPVARAMTVLEEMRKTAQFGPAFTRPLQKLIHSIGLTEDLDVDRLLGEAFPSLTDAAGALRLLPVTLAGLQLPHVTQEPGVVACSNGLAQLPTEVQVLLNGSEVVICQPS